MAGILKHLPYRDLRIKVEKLLDFYNENDKGIWTPTIRWTWKDIGPLMWNYKVDIEHPIEHLGNIGQCTIYREGDTDIKVEWNNEDDILKAIVVCILEANDAN